MHRNTSAQRVQASGPTDRYTRLPDALIEVLTPREHQLVHLLLSYRWFDDSEVYPFVGTMAARLGCSRRTIQRTLRSLEGKGYLVTVARYRDDSDHGQTSSLYAPGPMLLPLLPRTDDAPTEQRRRPPMTAGAPRKETPVNTTQRMGQNTGSERDYYSTRSGPLRCRDCRATEHQTGWCTQPSRR